MITVETARLSRALDLAHLTMERRNTVPVLGALRISANGRLMIEGTDLDSSTLIMMPYHGHDDTSFSLMGTRALRQMLRATGAEQVSLAYKDSKVKVTTGRMEARLATLPADNHPGASDTLVGTSSFTADVGAAELTQLRRVMPAMSDDKTRYYLNGIAVRHLSDWTWRFVATDGHKLMVVDIPLPNAKGTIPDDTIMPRRFIERAMVAFSKATGPITVMYGEKTRRNTPDVDLGAAPETTRVSLATTFGDINFALSSKLIDGTYPDFARVIPTGYTHLCRVDRAELIRAICALTSLGTGNMRAVSLEFQAGLLTCRLTSADLGEGTYAIPCEHNISPGGQIGFNGSYLLSCLRALTGDEAELHFSAPENMAAYPAVIRDPADTAFFSVLMPMRV